MGKVRFLFVEEVKKAVLNPIFPVYILAVFCLCLFVPIEPLWDTDRTNAFRLLFFMPKEELLSESSLTFIYVMEGMQTGYFVMFVPMVVGLVLLPVLCAEKESGQFRYVIVRCGKRKTILGKLYASLFCGGLAVAAGYLLAGLVMYVRLPHGRDALETDMLLNGARWLPSSLQQMPCGMLTAILFGQMVTGVYFYGMVCALWTYLLSAVVQNRYLLVCIPYMVLWFAEKWLDAAVMSPFWGRKKIISWLYRYSAGYTMQIFRNLNDSIFLLLGYAVAALLALWVQSAVMKGRRDCGA